MYAVALDPGVTTGGVYVKDRHWTLHPFELGPEQHHGALLELLTLWKPLYIICESFENRGNVAAHLVSAEYVGVTKAYASRFQTKLVLQSAAVGKGFWDNNRLRQAGAYVRGKRHANDAIRHYLHWQTFSKGNRHLAGMSGFCQISGAWLPMHFE
jgi:hypothetical protein